MWQCTCHYKCNWCLQREMLAFHYRTILWLFCWWVGFEVVDKRNLITFTQYPYLPTFNWKRFQTITCQINNPIYLVNLKQSHDSRLFPINRSRIDCKDCTRFIHSITKEKLRRMNCVTTLSHTQIVKKLYTSINMKNWRYKKNERFAIYE